MLSNWMFLTVGCLSCRHGTLKYLTKKTKAQPTSSPCPLFVLVLQQLTLLIILHSLHFCFFSLAFLSFVSGLRSDAHHTTRDVEEVWKISVGLLIVEAFILQAVLPLQLF